MNNENELVHWTGIGSRDTPLDVLKVMTTFSSMLNRNQDAKYVLRSGNARGADKAFEKGVRMQYENSLKELDVRVESYTVQDLTPGCWSFHTVRKYHPYVAKGGHLHPYVRKLMARSAYQVLGKDGKTPSKFLVCWTPDGATSKTTIITGGTGQAIRIANDYSIPVYNLANKSTLSLVRNIGDFLKHVNNNKK